MASQGFGGGADDQDRLLDEATAVVKEQAFYMKRAMDNDNLREALKHASNLICELRTSLLSPKNYYELYMQVFQEMQHLDAFFSDKSRHGRKMLDLYESVQHAGNILPRLYLLATVGASYIKSKEAPAKEILKDMGELTKGVQHPIRGLFLRYYLSQMVKDKLPDTGTEYEAEGGGNIDDAFDFILTNFIESNRLWVRIQHQGPQKDKQKREKERHDLRVLVGANLVRLSQLEGMTVDYYADTALPKLLEHVLSVKDTMSQQYLFESMIQVFPDEFHIRTLEQELAAYTKAQPAVDMKPVMAALMKRLADFLANAEGTHALTGVDIFALFRTHLQAILERTLEPSASGGATSVPDIAPPLELQAAFMHFTVQLYPDKLHYVDIILGSTVEILQKYFARVGDGSPQKLGSTGAEKVAELISFPLNTMGLGVLEMETYPVLLGYLAFPNRRSVANNMIASILDEEKGTKLTTVEGVTNLFNFITPLIMDEDDTPYSTADPAKPPEDENFVKDQQNVCRLIHNVETDSIDTEFKIYTEMRNSFFGKGGPHRLVHTMQPVINNVLGLIPKLKKLEAEREELGEDAPPAPAVTFKKVFQFVHKSITSLNAVCPEIALQTWLRAAVLADQVAEFEEICQEFLVQAMVVFEEEITESSKQYKAIFELVGTMTSIENQSEENFMNIAQKITQHANRLLKKPMQCRAIAAASQLYWCKCKMNGTRVLECLQKCLKITDAVVQASPKEVGLWVEMMDRYMFFFEQGCPEVTGKYICSLRNLCQEHIEFAENDSSSQADASAAKTHLAHTEKYIADILSSGSKEEKELFAEIQK